MAAHDDVFGRLASNAAIRLARVALNVGQRGFARQAEVGWRTIQRIELDEPVRAETLLRVQEYLESQGIVFLPGDPAGWGIRVPAEVSHRVASAAALRSVRVGLGLSVDGAARLSGLGKRTVNRIEAEGRGTLETRFRLEEAYAAKGVVFLPPEDGLGWGFRIPGEVSPERGRVLLLRPRRRPAG